MLMNVNGVVRLTKDVDLRYTGAGTAIASISVASSEKFKDASGEQKENTCFVEVSAFGKLAEICNQYLSKGSRIYIQGKLGLDQWTAQDGTKRSRHKITLSSMEMLDTKAQTAPAYRESNAQQPNQNVENGYAQQVPPEIDINDDEIPF